LKIKIVLITVLIVLSFTDLAFANVVSLENGKVVIYDNTYSNKLFEWGNSEYNYYTVLETYNGVAYAGGSGGWCALDINAAKVINDHPSGGSAGQVHDIVCANKLLFIGTEYTVSIYDVSKPSSENLITRIDTPIEFPDIDVKQDTLYIDKYKYDIRTPASPRCINPGAFLAIYDNNGTWALDYVNSWYSPEIVGFGWHSTEPIIGDWNGDGFKEVGIYNRAGNNFLIPANNQAGYEVIGLGWARVTPVVGDFDGDGDDDVGVYDNKGTWALSTNNGFKIVGFGWAGTEPVVGDWDGDGDDDVGIYNRPGNNFLIPKGSSFYIVGLGWKGVTPIVGNWDTDINDEVGVYDPKTSTFALAGKNPFTFGKPGSQPLVGDVDFNGITEVGVCEPDGTIIIKK